MLFFAAVAYVHCIDPGRLRRVEQLMAFHQFWPAYQELGGLIAQSGGHVDNRLYRLRGQCCLSMSMASECIDEAQRLLKNNANPDDVKFAHVLIARSYILQADYKKAEESAQKSGDSGLRRSCQDLLRTKSSAEAKANSGQVDEAAQMYDQLLRNSPKAIPLLLARANLSWLQQDLGRYKDLTNDLEKAFPNDGQMTYRRGIVSLCDGQMDPAMRGLQRASTLRGAPRDAGAALKFAQLVNKVYPEAQQQIEQRRADEANKSIMALKEGSEPYCATNSVLVLSLDVLAVKLLKITQTREQFLETLNEMVKSHPDNMELLMERGELLIEMEDYDAANFDFTTVQRRAPNQRAQDGVNRATELKKKATYVDYYEILGVPKNAMTHEIQAGYKRLARQWHPDRFSDTEKKMEAEHMMKKINTAYDILGDSEKRRRYDQGIDPDNPGQQNMNPFDFFFQGGAPQFHFQQGGGQGFQFHFGGGQGFQFHF